jgi:hypothetical protein
MCVKSDTMSFGDLSYHPCAFIAKFTRLGCPAEFSLGCYQSIADTFVSTAQIINQQCMTKKRMANATNNSNDGSSRDKDLGLFS